MITLSVIQERDWQGDLNVSLVPVIGEASPSQPGKAVGDVLLVEGQSGSRRLLVSLGPQEKIIADTCRQAGGALARWLAARRVTEAAVSVESVQALDVDGALNAFCEGVLLGDFRFERHKSGGEQPPATLLRLLASGEEGWVQRIVEHSQAVAAGVNLAREWAHEPPNVINPATLAERVGYWAVENNLKCTILGENELRKLGAQAILSVGLGSANPSQMIILEYPGQDSAANSAPVVLVGKAITFDTGGYSLKDRTGIVGMKYDKAGGAAVLGVMQAAVALRFPLPLVAIVAAAENMISADAYRPNDIIKTLSGKTVEIISTDAEGRMVLSDALTYAHTNYSPRAMIDVATLTGGIVVALGNVRAGLMSNDDSLAADLLAAGERAHERLWRMPLDDEYFELIKGDDSDFKNSSGQRMAHPIVGGIFLKQFVPDDIPWAHLDIAGPATTEKDQPYCPKGATGFGVRLLVEYLEGLFP